MEDIKVILKKPVFVIGLEIAGALVISAVLVWFIILPKYKSWQQLANENKKSRSRIEKIDKNIAAIRSVDASEVASLYQKLTTLLPEEGDALRFFSLTEKIIAASGMKLTSAQLEGFSANQGVVSGASTSSTPSLSPASGSSSTSPVVPKSASQAKSTLGVRMSVEGDFPALLTLLSNFGKGDRATQVSSLSLSGGQGGLGQLTVTFDLSLPTATQAAPVSMDTAVALTQDTKKTLQDLVAKIQFTASSTTNPIGRENPFK